MKKIITTIIFLSITVSLYAAVWSYYLIDMSKCIAPQRTELVAEMDALTGGRASTLNYCIYNSTNVGERTRMMFDSYDTIENADIYTTLIGAGAIEKVRTSIRVTTKGSNIVTVQTTIIRDHTTGATSFYMINGVE